MKSLFKKILWSFFLTGFFFIPAPVTARIEVVCFHAPDRCPTCVAAENNTKNILGKHFKTQLSNGQITFVSLDLKESENEPLSVFPTLLILKKQGKKELKTDFPATAFQYACTIPGNMINAYRLKSAIN
jgi:hypothetical protein